MKRERKKIKSNQRRLRRKLRVGKWRKKISSSPLGKWKLLLGKQRALCSSQGESCAAAEPRAVAKTSHMPPDHTGGEKGMRIPCLQLGWSISIGHVLNLSAPMLVLSEKPLLAWYTMTEAVHGT